MNPGLKVSSGNGFLDLHVLAARRLDTVALWQLFPVNAIRIMLYMKLWQQHFLLLLCELPHQSFDTSFAGAEESPFVRLTTGSCPDSCFSVLEDITSNTEVLIQSHRAGII